MIWPGPGGYARHLALRRGLLYFPGGALPFARAVLGVFCAGLTGFTVPLNPFTALIVGFLGLPGAGLVIALKLLL